MRSQEWPSAGIAVSTTPCSFLTRIEPKLFRTLVLRRLRLPLSLSHRCCRCSRFLDVLGYHRAAAAWAGLLGGWTFASDSATARSWRQAGTRVTAYTLVHVPNVFSWGALRKRATCTGHHMGVRIARRRQRSSSCCGVMVWPGLLPNARKNQLALNSWRPGAVPDRWCLQLKVGGRWSTETLTILRPALMRAWVKAKRKRWCGCAAARAFLAHCWALAALMDTRLSSMRLEVTTVAQGSAKHFG